MHVLIRRAAVMAGTAAVVLGSAAGVASAGGAPVLAWSSPGVSAGTFSYDTVAGGSTTRQTFTLTNSGGSASAVLTVTVTGPAFTVQSDTCTGTSLGPRKSCTVTVAYKPGTGGGTDTGTLTAIGNKAAATASLKLSGAVADIVTVTNPGPQTSVVGGTVGLPMLASDSASGQTLTWSATGLPAGLSINSATGAITSVGTPTSAGTFPVTVTATDTTGASGSASFTWTVSNTVTVTSPGPQESTNGDPITLLIEGDDSASGQTLTWSATGLPKGIVISPLGGIIQGVVSSSGTFSVTVTATDGTGASGSASFTWTVNPVTVTVTSPGPQTSTDGDPITLPIEGGDSAGRDLTWSATGLPSGMVISRVGGIIQGELTAAGTFSVAVTATDPVTGDSGSASFTWTVNPDVVTVPAAGNQKSTVGVAASLQMTGSDSASLQTLTWSAPDLPAGLSINSATGQITGTPTSAGTFSVKVTATDAVTGTSGSASFTWTVGVTVSVTITGEPNTGCGACAVITIDATGLSGSGVNTCSSADSCSLWVHTGDSVDVSLVSPVGPFTYTCGGSASHTAAGPDPEGRYTGTCQATVTSDYDVTASF